MKQKILIIEDNTEIRESTAELLELAGYEVSSADNGRSGLTLIADFLPDLIICDIRMEEMDGYAVLAELKGNPRTAEVPFLFCTAQSEKKDIQKAEDTGVKAYLIKPFTQDELFTAIETSISGRSQIG
ncbi:MAG TPA: response regulator [Mucilaginibacter sp.]|nr:response regulator [Mucilaginibacter sp.]